MQAFESNDWQEGIDSKALLVCFLRKLPYLLLMGVAGAVLGSGLYLLIAVTTSEGTMYQAETEYYIDFAEGKLAARDHYNAYTWNDVLVKDWILGNSMQILGPSYNKADVKSMITAEMLSDVRYLTIKVAGSDAETVKAVSDAMRVSVETFPSRENIDDFEVIRLIEDNGVQQIKEPLFTWRAMFLGALCGIAIGMFRIAVSFCIGSCYYTKQMIHKSLRIPVFGLLYQNGNESQGVQERGLFLALQHCIEKESCKHIVIMDILKNGYAQKCKDALYALYSEEFVDLTMDVQGCEVLSKEKYDSIRQTDGVILAIPFGRSSREAAIDILCQFENMDCKILGAILADVDQKWLKLYGIY